MACADGSTNAKKNETIFFVFLPMTMVAVPTAHKCGARGGEEEEEKEEEEGVGRFECITFVISNKVINKLSFTCYHKEVLYFWTYGAFPKKYHTLRS